MAAVHMSCLPVNEGRPAHPAQRQWRADWILAHSRACSCQLRLPPLPIVLLTMTQEQGAQIEVVEEAQAPTKALKTAAEAPSSEGAAAVDAPAENGTSQNGHGGDHAGSESEEVADAQSASTGEPAEEELWRRR